MKVGIANVDLLTYFKKNRVAWEKNSDTGTDLLKQTSALNFTSGKTYRFSFSMCKMQDYRKIRYTGSFVRPPHNIRCSKPF